MWVTEQHQESLASPGHQHKGFRKPITCLALSPKTKGKETPLFVARSWPNQPCPEVMVGGYRADMGGDNALVISQACGRLDRSEGGRNSHHNVSPALCQAL